MSNSFTAPERVLLEVLVGGRAPTADVLDTIALTASELRVEGALLSSLERARVDPGVHAEKLTSARIDVTARNLWLRHGMELWSTGLFAAGIDHRVVKGGALLAHYETLGDRWLDDIDVLFAQRDRARVAAYARGRGLVYRAVVRHDGVSSRFEKDGTSADVLGPADIPLDLHFSARPLPPASRDSPNVPSVPAVAIGLAEHVIEHHAFEPRLVARLMTDLVALCADEGPEPILDAARASPALSRALGWLADLGAPALRDVVTPVPLEFGARLPARARRMARRSCVLGRDGQLLRALWPARAYLAAHDGKHGTLWLHLRRWHRISGIGEASK